MNRAELKAQVLSGPEDEGSSSGERRKAESLELLKPTSPLRPAKVLVTHP